VHHRLQSSADRLEPGQARQVQGCSVQSGQHAGTVAPVAVGILIELGVPDPMPSLNTSVVSHQLQKGFWGGKMRAAFVLKSTRSDTFFV
jgi:hypothetical protein